MPLYRIYRIKHTASESFRWAAHTGGLAVVKSRDYDISEEVEAASPYSAWKQLTVEGERLRPGDLLEEVSPDGGSARLHITKYIGFEPAQWYVPEPKPEGAPEVALTSGEATDPAVASDR
jgi:hypothetical protein